MSSRQRAGVLPLLAAAVLLGVCSSGAPAAARQKQEMLPTKRGAKTSTVIEGTIAAIDLKASPPRVAVEGGGNRHWLLPLDVKQTIVWRTGGAEKVTFSQLKVGERIKATYGKGSPPAAAEVLILEEPPPPAPVLVAAPSATPRSSSTPDQDKARGGESSVDASR